MFDLPLNDALDVIEFVELNVIGYA